MQPVCTKGQFTFLGYVGYETSQIFSWFPWPLQFPVMLQGSDGNGFPKNEHLYKVLVIGELGTGKTSIIKRYVHQFFSQHYRATIGVDFALKVVHWDQNTVIRLQLWDIAGIEAECQFLIFCDHILSLLGQERFGNMTRVYYKEAVGAFIVFDVTRSSTFDSVIKWKQDLDSKVQLPDGNPIPCVLLANKVVVRYFILENDIHIHFHSSVTNQRKELQPTQQSWMSFVRKRDLLAGFRHQPKIT